MLMPLARSRRKAWMPGLRAAVSVAILVVLAVKIDWAHVGDAFRGARWGAWLGAAGIYCGAQLFSSLRWQWLSQPLGFQRHFRHYVGDYFVGMFFNLLLPTSVGGDAVRAIRLNAGSGRAMPALISVLFDRLSGLLVLLAMACAAVLCCSEPLPSWMTLAIFGTAGCALVGIALLPTVLGLVPRVASRWNLVSRLSPIAHSINSAFGQFRGRLGLVIATSALSLLIQLSGIVQVGLIGEAVGAEVSWMVYGAAVPMVALLTLLPVSLNGMGLREAGMVVFLAPAGVPAGLAVTIAFLWFCSQAVAGLAGAVVYLVGRSHDDEECHDNLVRDHSDQGRARQRRTAA
jgi:uncharacterized protein (TIRG00374 family)